MFVVEKTLNRIDNEENAAKVTKESIYHKLVETSHVACEFKTA